MNRSIIFLLFGLLVFGCGKENKHEIEIMKSHNKGNYFIEVKSFKHKTDAIKFTSKIHNINEEQVHLFKDTVDEQSPYLVCFGPYRSSFIAGKTAYNFFSRKIIDNYKILQNLTPVFDEFANLIFVGNYNGLNSLFDFNLKSDSVSLFWQNPGEKVIELVGTEDTNIVFFLTAKSTEREGIFPAINGVQLYRIVLTEEKVFPVKYLGDAIQIFTEWIDENSFKIIYNSFDKNVSTYVNQQALIFNTGGKVLSDINKTFDLVKENYPVLPNHNLQTISPDGKYLLLDSVIAGRNDYYLKTRSKKHFIFSTIQRPEHVEWKDNKFLVFSTNDISPTNRSIFSNSPQTSTLTIYDLKDKKIISHWINDGVKNFLFKSNFLFFDDGFGKKSQIFIYDLDSHQMKDTISISGGCGLRNIPYFPKFK